jgi:hypothetical protein
LDGLATNLTIKVRREATQSACGFLTEEKTKASSIFSFYLAMLIVNQCIGHSRNSIEIHDER